MAEIVPPDLESRIHPQIIQGGMGAGVSNWRLARAVSLEGELGVVSGTGLDSILARRLQKGDIGGHMRRAMNAFPIPEIADKVLQKYFVQGGIAENEPFKLVYPFSHNWRKDAVQLNVLANFVEVYLAKEGHDNPVGVNYLEKFQVVNLSAAYGAILAGVDYILMGAGLPMMIPEVLDKLSRQEQVDYRMDVVDKKGEESTYARFDPRIIGGPIPELKRPHFFAIVSSYVLAKSLLRADVGPDGFIVETHVAGGHNAPPRNKKAVNDKGEPVYSEKDFIDIEKIASLGLPYWLAGGYGRRGGLADALDLGANGIQVGSLFSLAEESGYLPELRKTLINTIKEGRVEVFTDPEASPTKFPFKVAQIIGTLSEKEVYTDRHRICDMGYLRHAYENSKGRIAYRCPSEPIDDFVRREGEEKDAEGRKCLCNALMANIGLAQNQEWGRELPLITAGDNINIARELLEERDSYKAAEVINFLRAE